MFKFYRVLIENDVCTDYDVPHVMAIEDGLEFVTPNSKGGNDDRSVKYLGEFETAKDADFVVQRKHEV